MSLWTGRKLRAMAPIIRSVQDESDRAGKTTYGGSRRELDCDAGHADSCGVDTVDVHLLPTANIDVSRCDTSAAQAGSTTQPAADDQSVEHTPDTWGMSSLWT